MISIAYWIQDLPLALQVPLALVPLAFIIVIPFALAYLTLRAIWAGDLSLRTKPTASVLASLLVASVVTVFVLLVWPAYIGMSA